MFAQKTARFLSIITLMSLMMLIVSSSEAYGKPSAEMSLKAVVSDGRLILSVSSDDICGFIGELEYDSGSFSFLKAEKNEALGENFHLSYIAKDARVRFLLDGDENIGKSGEIIRFYFDYLEDRDGMFAFSVYPASDAYFWENGRLLALELEPFGVAVKCKAVKNDLHPSLKPTDAVAVENISTNGGFFRVFCASVGNFCFCGLNISVVDLEDQSVERYHITRALPPFEDKVKPNRPRYSSFDIEIPEGKAVIIITPAVYDRGETRGENRAYYFSGGKLIEY